MLGWWGSMQNSRYLAAGSLIPEEDVSSSRYSMQSVIEDGKLILGNRSLTSLFGYMTMTQMKVVKIYLSEIEFHQRVSTYASLVADTQISARPCRAKERPFTAP